MSPVNSECILHMTLGQAPRALCCCWVILATSCSNHLEQPPVPSDDAFAGCKQVTGSTTFAVEALLPLDNSNPALLKAELCFAEDCISVDLDSRVAVALSPGNIATTGWSHWASEQSAYLAADGSEGRWRLHLGIDGSDHKEGEPWHLRVISLASGRLLVQAADTIPKYMHGVFPCTDGPGSIARLDAGSAAPDDCASSAVLEPPTIPVLHYAFEGDARNTGALGANHDGNATAVSYVAGKLGQGLATYGSPSYLDASLADFVSAGLGFTLGLWFRSEGTGDVEIMTGLGIRVYAYQRSGRLSISLYRPTNPASITIEYTPMVWHHLAFRSTAMDADVEVLLDGRTADVLPNAGRVPLWADVNESITLGVGPSLIVDELTIFDSDLADAPLCQAAIGGQWCATGVCGLP